MTFRLIALIALIVSIIAAILGLVSLIMVKPVVNSGVGSDEIRDDGEIILNNSSTSALRRATLQENGALVMEGLPSTNSFDATIVYFSNGKRLYKNIAATLKNGEPAVVMLPKNTNGINISITKVNGVSVSTDQVLKVPGVKAIASVIIAPALALITQIVAFILYLQVLYPTYEDGNDIVYSVYGELVGLFICIGATVVILIIGIVAAVIYKKKVVR